MYLVNEIFESIQGEASFTGTACVFIRLQGCPVGCSWCDTKHTWTVEEDNEISPFKMLHKENDSPKYAQMTSQDIFNLVRHHFKSAHIVLTGGEPCAYDLQELTSIFIECGYTVQIETSGVFPIKCHQDAFVTVSPKLNMAGGYDLDRSALKRANEIKYPVGRARDIELLETIVLPLTSADITYNKIWLQPLSQNESATKICIKHAQISGYRLSIQTHKFIGVR